MTDHFKVRDERKPGHHWADNEILDNFGSVIGPVGYAIYMFLSRHAGNRTAKCTKSQQEIAFAFGISRDTVNRHIPKLIESGLICVIESPGYPSEYILAEVDKGVPQNQTPTPRQNQTGVPQNQTPTPRQNQTGVPQNQTPNKEVRLSSRLEHTSTKQGGEPPARNGTHVASLITQDKLMEAQQIFWKSYEALPVNPERNRDADENDRLHIAARKAGLTDTFVKDEVLGKHPHWRLWPYRKQFDSQSEIQFPADPPKIHDNGDESWKSAITVEMAGQKLMQECGINDRMTYQVACNAIGSYLRHAKDSNPIDAQEQIAKLWQEYKSSDIHAKCSVRNWLGDSANFLKPDTWRKKPKEEKQSAGRGAQQQATKTPEAFFMSEQEKAKRLGKSKV